MRFPQLSLPDSPQLPLNTPDFYSSAQIPPMKKRSHSLQLQAPDFSEQGNSKKVVSNGLRTNGRRA
jgi:hypothetical protein